jgi:hypothetical protein
MKLSFGLALALLTAMSVSAHPADPVAIREGEVSAGSTGAQLEVPAAYLATFKGKGFVDGEIEGDNGEYDEDYEDYEDDWEHDSPEKRQSGAAMRAAAKWMKISGVQVTQEELKRFGDDVAFGRVERNPKVSG